MKTHPFSKSEQNWNPPQCEGLTFSLLEVSGSCPLFLWPWPVPLVSGWSQDCQGVPAPGPMQKCKSDPLTLTLPQVTLSWSSTSSSKCPRLSCATSSMPSDWRVLPAFAGPFPCIHLFFFFVLILRQGRKRGRERIPSRFCTISAEPNARLKFINHEIMT